MIFRTFDDFERFSHPWSEQSNTGNDNSNAFLCFFAGRSTACVFYHYRDELRICGNFVVNFRRFWSIFSSIAWAKQHRERKQLMRFDAFSQVKRRHAFLIIAISIFTIFRGHFAVILDAFWCSFARFWIPVRKPDLRLRMNLGARQNASFLSIFEAFLTLQKSSSPHCFADFLKKKNKTWSRKSESFLGHLFMDIAFFDFFTRPRKNMICEVIGEYRT